MSLTLIAILIIIGLIFLILEVLVVPGTTIIGVAGFLLIVLSVWQAYVRYGTSMGHLLLLITIVLTIALFTISFKAKTWKRISLNTELHGKVNEIDAGIHTGDTGKSISRLAPAGKALINGQFLEVHTSGEFIDQETPVEVTHIADNKVFVKQKL